MNDKVKKILKLLFVLIILLACGYYVVRDIDFEKLWQILVNADYLWVVLSIPVMLISHWVRAYRWKTMLEPIVKGSKTWDLFSAVMVGYAANNVISRGGEFLRPYVYAKRAKVSFSSLFATIVVERFLDLFILVLLFGFVSLFFSEQIKIALPNLQIEKLLIPTVLLIAVLCLAFYPPFVKAMLRIFVKPFSHKFYDKLVEIFNKFTVGIAILKKPSQYLRLFIESQSIWILYAIPMYLMFFSFGFQSTHNLGFDDALLLIVISGIGFTVAPTPGAFGVYHFLIQNAMMKLYGISSEEALAYATLTHAINYLVQVSVGGLFLLRENVKKIPHKEDITEDMN
jgi:uncharacterized protein (TIRG00374 family)